MKFAEQNELSSNQKQNAKMRMKTHQAFRFQGRKFTYLVLRDYSCGRRNRFTVMVIPGTGDPVIIGRELPMSTSKKVISRFDYFGESYDYMGEREVLLYICEDLDKSGLKL